MNRFILMKNSTLFCLLSLALGVTITLGGTKTKAPKDTDQEWELLKQFEHDFAAAKDQLAEEKYEKGGAQITSWMKDAALPSPDNAALLYYQAFLLCSEQDLAISLLIDNILKGAEPNRQIRT